MPFINSFLNNDVKNLICLTFSKALKTITAYCKKKNIYFIFILIVIYFIIACKLKYIE